MEHKILIFMELKNKMEILCFAGTNKKKIDYIANELFRKSGLKLPNGTSKLRWQSYINFNYK